MQLTASSLIQHCLGHRNSQIKDNLDLVRPIATHYALHSGHDRDDLLQVGYLGLIKASKRFKLERGDISQLCKTTFGEQSFTCETGLIDPPSSIGQERAIQLMQSPEQLLNAQDALTIQHYRAKHQWVEFNDDVVDDNDPAMALVERSEVFDQISNVFRQIEKDKQLALQMVVIEGMSLRKTALQLGVSAMTVQRRVKRGLRNIANGLKSVQDGD